MIPRVYPLIVRPVDKRENYIKRCTAIAERYASIKKNGILFINNKPGFVPPYSATDYLCKNEQGNW